MSTKIPADSALRGLASKRGQYSNGQGQNNALAEGECIICPRQLLYCPSALTSPVMHYQLVPIRLLLVPKVLVLTLTIGLVGVI